MSSRIKINILLIFMVYLYPIVFKGFPILSYGFIYGIPIIYILVNFRIIVLYFRKIYIYQGIMLFLWFILLYLSFLFPIIYNTNDFTYVNVVLALFRRFIITVFLILIIVKNHGVDSVMERFMYYFALSTLIYVVSTILFIVFPSLKEKWFQIIVLENNVDNLLLNYGYTMRIGWQGFSGFRNTISCTLSVVFILYLKLSKYSSLQISNTKFVIIVLTSIMGNMFYGRIGIVASAGAILISVLFYKKFNLRIFIRIILVFLFLFVIIFFVKSYVPVVQEWYTWMSKPFINLFRTGHFNNYSTDMLLKKMIFMPEFNTLIHGDGRYTVANFSIGRYYMGTDSGFMRQILFWGIVPTAIIYFMWFRLIFSISKDYVLISMLLYISILFEIKGETYYEIIPLLLVFSIVNMYKSKSNHIVAHTLGELNE